MPISPRTNRAVLFIDISTHNRVVIIIVHLCTMRILNLLHLFSFRTSVLCNKQYKHCILYYSKMNRVEQMKKIQNEALELFTKKNIDYGDAFAKYGVIGVLMRIEDKLQRSMSITKNGVNLINDEGIRDTLIDLHNYAAMALMLIDE